MTEQKFNYSLEEAAKTYFAAAGFENDDRFGTPAWVANGYLRERSSTIAEIFERASNQSLGTEFLATILIRQERVTKRIPEITFRYYLTLQTQKELGEVELEILKAKITPIMRIKDNEIRPLSLLEERKRNLENLKQMLLAQVGDGVCPLEQS